MKALSVRQPWASLIAQGEKTLEMRSRPTSHRGDLVICSSARPDGYPGPAGFALCVVDVVDCRRMRDTRADIRAAQHPYDPDCWVYVLANVRRIEPFRVKGRLGIFELEYPR